MATWAHKHHFILSKKQMLWSLTKQNPYYWLPKKICKLFQSTLTLLHWTWTTYFLTYFCRHLLTNLVSSIDFMIQEIHYSSSNPPSTKAYLAAFLYYWLQTIPTWSCAPRPVPGSGPPVWWRWDLVPPRTPGWRVTAV